MSGGEEMAIVNKIGFALILIFLALAVGLIFAGGDRTRTVDQGSDELRAFKVLKEKMKDPKTGLPKTLDPNLIEGKDREGYRIAKEIPEVLAQIPCFCGCEALGHENLLDCFVDRHAVG
jgi:hypothetical protein